MLACWIEDPNSEAFKLHVPRIYDYLWLAEDGMKMKVTIVESFFLVKTN
jgi:cycloartenol synthase